MIGDVGVVTIADAKSGARVSQERAGGVYTASPVAADGKIYFLSEGGETVVPVERTVRPEFSPATSSMHGNWHRRRFSGGRLFIRTDDALYAIGSEIPLALGDGGPSDNYLPIAYRLRSVRMYHRPSTRAGDANVVSPILFT